MPEEKDYPLDEGLPPASAEKSAVDEVIQYEVSEPVTAPVATVTIKGGTTWTGADIYTSSSPIGSSRITVDKPGIVDRVKSLFTKPEPATGFKAYGDHWLAVYSNNFEDREGEIFPAKAIDEYIGRLDSGITPQPELWVWHKGGHVRIGQADTTFRIGGFVVSAGSFDSTDVGQHAKTALPKEKDLGMSHGFQYDPASFDGKHYWKYNTFEISVLPRRAAANLFTSFEEIKAMAMTKDQRDFISRITGKPAEELEKSLEDATKSLESAGIAYKDFTAVPDEEPAVSEKTVEAANKAFGALVSDLTESLADVATVQEQGAKALAGYKATVDGQIATLTKSLDDLTALVQGMVSARPAIASRSDENTVESAGLSKQITDALLDDESNYETVAGIRVRKMQR